MTEIIGCGCGGGQELSKVSTPSMKKPAIGNKQGKAPKPEGKQPRQNELQK